MRNPKGRVNYEPNSWGDARRAARVAREGLPAPSRPPVEGPKVRPRSETFADHYSQARQFYISQTPIEQTHIADALMFELSKVQTAGDPRADGVAPAEHRRRAWPTTVAKGLRLKEMPKPAAGRQADAPGPEAVAGAEHPQERPEELRRPQGRGAGHRRRRRRASSRRCAKALKAEGAMLKLIAPEVGGVKDSARHLARRRREARGRPVGPVRRRRDACRRRGRRRWRSCRRRATSSPTPPRTGSSSATPRPPPPLLEKAGAALDEGFVPLNEPASRVAFVTTCRKLRFWDRGAAKK